MTPAQKELQAHLNGKARDAAVLTEQLGLKAIGVHVVGAEVFGRGPTALVDIRLSDGRAIRCDRFGDLAKPAALSALLVTETGVFKTFKGAEAGLVAQAVYRLAEHHRESTQDDVVRDLAGEYLRVAATQEARLADQADRWRAFEAIARVNPARDAGEDRSSQALAAASLVLVDATSGQRLVRSDWIYGFVKRELGVQSRAELAARLEAVGWRRPNTQGRVKATCPTDKRQLAWAFFVVDADWADRVTAGYGLCGRARERTRESHKTPAVTSLHSVDSEEAIRNPAPEAS